MRMQKAEMEFVTFGAQDVIVTSGPFIDQGMTTMIGTIIDYNTLYPTHKLYNAQGQLNGIENATEQKKQMTLGYVAGEDDAKSLGSGTALRSADYGSSETKPENFFYAKEVADIVAWLTLNGHSFQ